MSTLSSQIHEGSLITGPLFNEPMRVETVRASGDGMWTLGLVGTQSERFRKVSLSASLTELLQRAREEIGRARFACREVTKVTHYRLEVDAMAQPLKVREQAEPFGGPGR